MLALNAPQRVFEGSQAAVASVEGVVPFDGNANLNLLDLNDHDGDLLSPSNGFVGDEGLYDNEGSPEADADLLGPPSSRPQYMEEQQQRLAAQGGDPPKIRVVVRKRPLNSKEIAKADPDIVDVASLTDLFVNETKTKVDLAKYEERHQFSFDDALDEQVSNDDVYRCTVQPLVATLFRVSSGWPPLPPPPCKPLAPQLLVPPRSPCSLTFPFCNSFLPSSTLSLPPGPFLSCCSSLPSSLLP